MRNPKFCTLLQGQKTFFQLRVFGYLNNGVWSLSVSPHLSYPSLESKKTPLLLPFTHPDITLTFSAWKFSGQGQLFVKTMWKELHVMRPVVHQRHLSLSCRPTYLSIQLPRIKSLYIPNICSRKPQELPMVVTYRVHNPIPSKAMQCSGTAATSLCQLGSLSGGNAPGGTADVCAPAQMGPSLPALAFAAVPE